MERNIYQNNDTIPPEHIFHTDAVAFKGTCIHTSIYNATFAVKIYLRAVVNAAGIMVDDRTYTCSITKLRNSPEGSPPLSQQFDVAYYCAEKVIHIIRRDVETLQGHMPGRKTRSIGFRRFGHVQMQVRLIPNFMREGRNLKSPMLPLYLNLKRDDNFLSLWFKSMQEVIQSAKENSNYFEDFFRFLG
ncbi:MAG TPA: hypothetical protein EYQ06_00595, partial [Flavobacteriales bacterium]|nr:hypothetical protein [Flavobacteriales bacterium]